MPQGKESLNPRKQITVIDALTRASIVKNAAIYCVSNVVAVLSRTPQQEMAAL
jgi:hypothetical protein